MTTPIRLEVSAEERTSSGLLLGAHVATIRNLLMSERGFALIPSDTCYGLAARPTGLAMSRIINQILQRDEEPISLAFDSIGLVERWAQLKPLTARLFEALTPGPLTVVCPLGRDVRPEITDDVLAVPDRTLGVRIPDSQVETQLVRACDHPLSTVAVRDPVTKSAITDFTTAREIVLKGLSTLATPRSLAIVEATHPFRTAHSTVVRIPSGTPGRRFDILRPGAISEPEIARALETVSQWETENYP